MGAIGEPCLVCDDLRGAQCSTHAGALIYGFLLGTQRTEGIRLCASHMMECLAMEDAPARLADVAHVPGDGTRHYGGALQMIPPHMRESVVQWIERGFPAPSLMGSFFRAVLSNDLAAAVANADPQNRAGLVHWAEFLLFHAPSACWGSPERVQAWHEGAPGRGPMTDGDGA